MTTWHEDVPANLQFGQRTYPSGQPPPAQLLWWPTTRGKTGGCSPLVYAMLTDQRPELLPDRARLRAAVEADDLAAVDALMEPLDCAAARLMTKVPAVWWGEVKPTLDAYADAVESDDGRDLLTVPWQEVEARHVVGRLVDRWRKAWVPVRNHNGYMDPPGVMWLAVKGWLDARLVDQHGGYAPGARIRFGDGRPAVVFAVEWGEDRPPVGYRVLAMTPPSAQSDPTSQSGAHEAGNHSTTTGCTASPHTRSDVAGRSVDTLTLTGNGKTPRGASTWRCTSLP